MSDLSADQVREHLPPYLSREAQDALLAAFSRVPDNKEYYLTGKYQKELLQGDCWGGFQVLRFETAERRNVLGVIFSNSCDIDPDNPRDLPPKVVFAPVISLTNYADALRKQNISEQKIASKFDAIRKQNVTTIFYLPDAVGGLDQEYMVLLDDVHSIPSAAFQESRPEKRFTLNNFGFYMFVFKLSIHFCRLRENVQR